jgi:hypothetical protein
MNTTFLTLCFYEHPAAKAHLDFWEKAMGDRILSKTEDFYVVKRSDDLELICCIKLNDLPVTYNSIKKTLSIFQQIAYFKTLIFGKVIENDLIEIIRFVSDIKNNFNVEDLKIV